MKVNPSKTIKELICVISYVSDIEGHKKIYHAWRVAAMSAEIAKNLSVFKRKNIFYAAMLHDIGAVGLHFHIIHYLRRNDKTSRNVLLTHPIFSSQLTSRIPGLSESARLIIDHHEWMNGCGYPRAKILKNIPLGAQVIRIADSVDIALQGKGNHCLKSIKKKLAANINKEYPKTLFSRTFQVLKKNSFFKKISKPKFIPQIFNELSLQAGLIKIPLRIDAIGQALEVIAEISDMKHPFTYGHSLRVSRYAMSIALAMKLGHDQVTQIKWAGLLHDIGKISVSRKILDKPAKLNRKEYKKIKAHAQITEEIMGLIPSLKEIIPFAAGHHERFDGSGYPYGLKGEKIPLGARIVTVCDAFDAMTSNRPYRIALPLENSCQQIKEMSGRQFDPEVVKFALPIFKNLRL